jgi:hypothetical protein
MFTTARCERCAEADATCEILDLASEQAERLCDECAARRFVPSDPLVHLRDHLRHASSLEDLSDLRHLRHRLDEALGLAIVGLTRSLRAAGTPNAPLASALGVGPSRVSQICGGGEERRAALRRMGGTELRG